MNRNLYYQQIMKEYNGVSLHKNTLQFKFSHKNSIESFRLFDALSSEFCFIDKKHQDILEIKYNFDFYDELELHDPLHDEHHYIATANANIFFDLNHFPSNEIKLYRLCNSKNEGVFQIALKDIYACFNHLSNPNYDESLSIIMSDEKEVKNYFFAFNSIRQMKLSIIDQETLLKASQKNKFDLYEITIDEKYIIKSNEQALFNIKEVISMHKMDLEKTLKIKRQFKKY